MVGRIQDITVEIGGDTTKLQTALKGVNTEIGNKDPVGTVCAGSQNRRESR